METTVLTRLLEISVYSTAIFLAVALFRMAFCRQLAPGLKYALWLIVLLRLMIPFTLESTFHLITLPQEPQQPAAVPTAAAAPLPSSIPSAVTQAPVSDAPLPTAGIPVPPQQEAPATARTPFRLTWRQWLLLLWAAGFTAVIAAQIGMALQLKKRVRLRGVAPDRSTQALYQSVKDSLRIRANVPVLLVDDISSPALTVQLFPQLLLPDGLVDNKSSEEQVFSMAHELMHYKRCDHIVLLVLSVLRAIYWFNPVVWLLPRFLRTDMESACDAQVVRRMNKQQKLKYASLLLELGQKENEK